jgi:Protein of unknown function (DUF3592)
MYGTLDHARMPAMFRFPFKSPGSPSLDGLEEILEDVRDRKIGVDEAAARVRRSAARGTSLKFFSPPPLIFQLAGGFSALIGIAFGCYSLSFAFGTVDVQGKVIRIESGSPVVQYDVNGMTHEYKSSISSTSPSYRVGEKVGVLYRPRDPSSAQINTFTDRWLFPTVFTAGGIIFALLGTFAPRLIDHLNRQFSPGRRDADRH